MARQGVPQARSEHGWLVRVMLRDILDYRDRTRRERRQTLDQMATDAEEDNLYEATATPKQTR
jgi:DNA-directed RNA polymerase specialized sigma24 family protein